MSKEFILIILSSLIIIILGFLLFSYIGMTAAIIVDIIIITMLTIKGKRLFKKEPRTAPGEN